MIVSLAWIAYIDLFTICIRIIRWLVKQNITDRRRASRHGTAVLMELEQGLPVNTQILSVYLAAADRRNVTYIR